MPGFPWTHGTCFWAWKWSSWASEVDTNVLALSEVDRGFKFCEASFLGVLKSGKDDPCLRAVSLALFHSVATCLTSHNPFLKTWSHKFLNRMGRKWNRPVTRLFFPSGCEKRAGDETISDQPRKRSPHAGSRNSQWHPTQMVRPQKEMVGCLDHLDYDCVVVAGSVHVLRYFAMW